MRLPIRAFAIRAFAIAFAGSLLFVAGCDTMNLKPKDEIPNESVWEDPSLMEGYLSDVYNSVAVGFGDPMQTAGQVDEAMNTHNYGADVITQSNMTPSNRGIWSRGWSDQINKRGFFWETAYSSIRNINIFLKNVEGSEAISSDLKEALLGEAYFLRAYFYHNLMKKFGGVPLIDQVFELSGDLEQYQVPRNTFKETINFIVADLDRAAQRLSLDGRQKGAATKGAALGLKSRVLLFAASDLYAASKSPFDMKEVKYTGGSQQDRWQKAKEAAQAVIDLGQYSLEQTSSAREYHELFTKGNESGTVWARYFSSEAGWSHNISLWVSPNGYNSWSGDTPTQQHVNAYEMADGSQFKWEGADPRSASEPVDAKNPYDNRDPRFEANILYNNAQWRPRPPALRVPEGQRQGIIQTGTYEVPGQKALRPGLDTRGSDNQSWNGTKTGYNLKKFVDRGINPNQEQAYNPYPLIRYAEVLLNYAEASAELGDTQDALRALNKVRERVGMPDVPADGGADRTLIERIRQEREVELAFEGHRYFDARRWMIGPEAYQDAKGVNVVGRLTSKDDPEAQQLVQHWYDYEYNVVTAEKRRWRDKNYFVPIPKAEMNRNPELVQNPGGY
jgi:hypothetical protein